MVDAYFGLTQWHMSCYVKEEEYDVKNAMKHYRALSHDSGVCHTTSELISIERGSLNLLQWSNVLAENRAKELGRLGEV